MRDLRSRLARIEAALNQRGYGFRLSIALSTGELLFEYIAGGPPSFSSLHRPMT